MGFRQNGIMTVWAVEPNKTGKTTKVRLSSSKKNKTTNEYEQDFSGFCTFIGKAHAAAANLKERDRIRILECDVGTTYNKERKTEYVNYKVFDYEMADGGKSASVNNSGSSSDSKKRSAFDEEGEVDEKRMLPF